jgi:hypothetical protein
MRRGGLVAVVTHVLTDLLQDFGLGFNDVSGTWAAYELLTVIQPVEFGGISVLQRRWFPRRTFFKTYVLRTCKPRWIRVTYARELEQGDERGRGEQNLGRKSNG